MRRPVALLLTLGLLTLSACSTEDTYESEQRNRERRYEEGVVKPDAFPKLYDAVLEAAKAEDHPRLSEARQISNIECHWEESFEDTGNPNTFCFVRWDKFVGDPQEFCFRAYNANIYGSNVRVAEDSLGRLKCSRRDE